MKIKIKILSKQSEKLTLNPSKESPSSRQVFVFKQLTITLELSVGQFNNRACFSAK